MVNLLFASCGVEPEIVELADDLEVLQGLVVPFAKVGHLIAMKLLSRDDRRRPADADDLRALAAVANDEDWDLARTAVQPVTKCGYGRDADLEMGLSSLTAEES